jgi:transcriptional regulator with XRE-family HTH domain
MGAEMIELVRERAGLTQGEFAARAGTSRTAVNAYEHGRKSPTLATVERLLDGVGYELHAEPKVVFVEVARRRGRPVFVADRLWRLPVDEAFAEIELPLALNWSRPGARFRLSSRRERARCYEIVLQDGMPADVVRFVDGALLVDLWDELVLPREVRSAWQPVMDGART